MVRAECTRYRKACSTDHDFFAVIRLFHHRLLNRGYPPSMIDPIIKEALKFNRASLLKPIQRRMHKRIPFITKIPHPRIKTSWNDLLQFPPLLLAQARFKRNIDDQPLIGQQLYPKLGHYFSPKSYPNPNPNPNPNSTPN